MFLYLLWYIITTMVAVMYCRFAIRFYNESVRDTENRKEAATKVPWYFYVLTLMMFYDEWNRQWTQEPYTGVVVMLTAIPFMRELTMVSFVCFHIGWGIWLILNTLILTPLPPRK